MSITPIINPITGQLMRFGSMHRRLEHNFIQGALPSWLTSEGTFVQEAMASNYGFGRATSLAPLGSRCGFRTTFNVGPHTYGGAMVSVEGMRMAADNINVDWSLGIENDARTQGFAVQQLATDTKAQIVVHATGQKSDINYLFWGPTGMGWGTRQQRRNLSILHVQADQRVFVLDRNRVIGWANAPGIGTDQTCYPRVLASTRVDGSPVTVQVGKMALDLWH